MMFRLAREERERLCGPGPRVSAAVMAAELKATLGEARRGADPLRNLR